MFLIAIFTIVFIILNWVVWARKWLKNRPWGWSQRMFAKLEPIEATLYSKSETILWARTKAIVGILLTILQSVQGIDITPLMPFLPTKYQMMMQIGLNLLPMSLTILGIIDEKLRRDTTQPLSLVSVTEEEKANNPVIAEAVATSEAVKEAAVATVEAEKATT